MDNKIQIFTNEQFGKIRTIEEDGKVLFCGSDIARALGYARPADAISAHCKGVCILPTPSAGGVQNTKFITEGDVYRLITHSKLPSAEKFESWVFDEVLPSIRKTGSYSLQQKPDSYMIEDPIERAERWIEEQKEKKQLALTVAVQNQQILELKPKATYYDIVLQCPDLLPTTEIAKDYGKSAKWLNEFLKEKKIQFKQNGMWLLYQKYAENGYTMSKTYSYTDGDGVQHAKLHTYWTQKGRLFLYDTLKSAGVLPVIEQTEETEELQ